MYKQAFKQTFENNNMEVAIEALRKSIARWTDKGDQRTTPIPGLSLYRRDEPTQPTTVMYEPRICVIAQGAKRGCLETIRMYMYMTRRDKCRRTFTGGVSFWVYLVAAIFSVSAISTYSISSTKLR